MSLIKISVCLLVQNDVPKQQFQVPVANSLCTEVTVNQKGYNNKYWDYYYS